MSEETVRSTEQEVPFRMLMSSRAAQKSSVDMAQVVGTSDILFVCLDTLRYDVQCRRKQTAARRC